MALRVVCPETPAERRARPLKASLSSIAVSSAFSAANPSWRDLKRRNGVLAVAALATKLSRRK
jgi:hypothetical protein